MTCPVTALTPDTFPVRCAVPGCDEVLETVAIQMRHGWEHERQALFLETGARLTESAPSKFSPEVWTVVL
jgi:hypothetical protein